MAELRFEPWKNLCYNHFTIGSFHKLEVAQIQLKKLNSWDDEKVPEMDSGYGCIALWMYFLRHCITYLEVVKMINSYGMYILPQFLKNSVLLHTSCVTLGKLTF